MMKDIAINTFMYEKDNIKNIIKLIDADMIKGLGLYSGHIGEFEEIKKNVKKKFKIVSYYVHFMDVCFEEEELRELEKKMKICSGLGIDNITVILSNKNKVDSWEELFMKLSLKFYKLVDKWKVAISIEILGQDMREQFCFTSIDKANTINGYIDKSKIKWIVDLYHSKDTVFDNVGSHFFQNVHSVHLSNRNMLSGERSFLDDGEIPIRKMIDYIINFEYQGWWEFEVLGQQHCSEENLKKVYHNIFDFIGR